MKEFFISAGTTNLKRHLAKLRTTGLEITRHMIGMTDRRVLILHVNHDSMAGHLKRILLATGGVDSVDVHSDKRLCRPTRSRPREAVGQLIKKALQCLRLEEDTPPVIIVMAHITVIKLCVRRQAQVINCDMDHLQIGRGLMVDDDLRAVPIGPLLADTAVA